MADEAFQLPDKLYFKIGEVSDLVGVPPYVLRYWESVFSNTGPTETASKHRLYRRKDVETLLEIKRLLHQQRFTIEGARKRLRDKHKEESTQDELPFADRTYRSVLAQVRDEIESLYRMLS